MAIDYDVLRGIEVDRTEDVSLGALTDRRRSELAIVESDVGDRESVGLFELSEADLLGEELSLRIIPRQANEFVCSRCFLVQHNSRIASRDNTEEICGDCD